MSEYSIYTIIITTLLLLYYINEHNKNNISNITKYFLKITLFLLFTLLIYDNINLFMSQLTPTEKTIIALSGALVANNAIQNAISPNSQSNIISNTVTLFTESNLLLKYLLSTSLSFTGYLTKSKIPIIVGAVGTAIILLNKDKITKNVKKVFIDYQPFTLITAIMGSFMAPTLGLNAALNN